MSQHRKFYQAVFQECIKLMAIMRSENVISCYSLYVRHSSGLVSVNQSLYRLGQALRVPEVWGSQISRLSAHEISRVVSPTYRRIYPLRIYS